MDQIANVAVSRGKVVRGFVGVCSGYSSTRVQHREIQTYTRSLTGLAYMLLIDAGLGIARCGLYLGARISVVLRKHVVY